jgi:hypothetical protein
MHVISVSLDVSTELAAASLITAATVAAGAITRLVLSALAVSVTRKALEDPPGGQADAIRAHRLAVLKAILATLSADHRTRYGPSGNRPPSSVIAAETIGAETIGDLASIRTAEAPRH